MGDRRGLEGSREPTAKTGERILGASALNRFGFQREERLEQPVFQLLCRTIQALDTDPIRIQEMYQTG